MVEFLYCLPRSISLQINANVYVRIASVSLTQTEKDRQINVPLQLDAQFFKLNASKRSVGGVSNRQATAERSEQLLHGIGGSIGSPIGVTLSNEELNKVLTQRDSCEKIEAK